MAVSPGGGTVFVTGSSQEQHADGQATVAYNAATGAQRWVSWYNGPASLNDYAASLTAAPDGRSVFVTGTTGLVPRNLTPGGDYATIACIAATRRPAVGEPVQRASCRS
jgi:hypothetical protein